MAQPQQQQQQRKEGPREAVRAFGRFFADAGRLVSQQAREAQDALVLLRHSQRFGGEDLPAWQQQIDGGASQTDSGLISSALSVEVLKAADLCQPRFGDLSAYCALTVLPGGVPWQAQAGSDVRQINTSVVLRDRHPQWGSTCTVPLPLQNSASENNERLELAVRVMNAGAIRSDRLLGEIRVPLVDDMRGAGTYRLQGGGHASISLRWSKREPQAVVAPADSHVAACPRRSGSDGPFEDAFAFWSAHLQGSNEDAAASAAQELGLLLAAGGAGGSSSSSSSSGAGACSSALIDELFLQAPLAKLLSCGGEVVGSLLPIVSGRVYDMSPYARSRLVGALAEHIVRPGTALSTKCDEELLCHVLQSTRGRDLIELKALIDKGGADHDLRHAVFVAVVDQAAREAVLAHFEAEAKLVEQPLHVLSDIDMTVWIGTFGSGGPKFPSGVVPGSMPLFQSLGGRVAFLSARPPIWEGRTRRMLMDDVGIAEAVVLPGTLKAVVQTIFQPNHGHRAMGERKFEVFLQYAQLHPQARFVFVGDSGEGDIDFALAFMTCLGDGLAKDRRDRAALIHDVVQSDGVAPRTPAARRAELRLGGVHVFDTFAGAALELHQHGFLDANGLRTAAHGCLEDFGQIQMEEFCSPEVFETRRSELLRDLRAVNAALRSADAGAAHAPTGTVTNLDDSKATSGPTEETADVSGAPDTAVSSSNDAQLHEAQASSAS